jgi:Spy/CpxP family protein refolding chaperone
MNSGLLATFLAGALVASAGMNIYLWQQSDIKQNAELGPGLRSPEVPLEDLELNQVQMNALARFSTEKAAAAADLRQRIGARTRELQEALQADPMAEDRVKELAEELRQLRREEVDQQVGTLLAVRELLTPYQTRLLYQVLYPEAAANR